MDLLRNILQVICDQANSHLNNIDHRSDDWVVLTSTVDHDGSLNQYTRSKIVMGVYNITREARETGPFHQPLPAFHPAMPSALAR